MKEASSNSPHARRGLVVIGAGMPRTGTKSIEEALHQLGYRVYDNRSIMKHHHEERWLDVSKAWKLQGDLKPMKELVKEIEALGYSATLDTPMNLLAFGLMEIRPDAKVLWTHRDSAEQWYASFQFISEFAMQWQYGRPWRSIFPQMSRWIVPIEQLLLPFRSGQLSDLENEDANFHHILPWYDQLRDDAPIPLRNPEVKQNWINFYNDLPQLLKDAIVAQQKLPESAGEKDDIAVVEKRFLEFNVKQGWGPLLDFLDAPEDLDVQELAEQPFPYVNEKRTLVIVNAVMNVLGAGLPLFVGMFLYLFFSFRRRVVSYVCSLVVRSDDLKEKKE